MKFRFHHGGLDDSMSTVVEIEPTLYALTTHINKSYPGIEKECLQVYPYGYDERINWNTHIVHSTQDGVIGFTDGPLDLENKND